MDPQNASTYVSPGWSSMPGVANPENFAPIVPGQIGLQGGGDAMWANLGRDELNALIRFRDQQLAAQAAQAGVQADFANRQLGQQGAQFGQQLSFNQAAQRAAEQQYASDLFFKEQQQRALELSTERARQSQMQLGAEGLQSQAQGQAAQIVQARAALAQSGYGQGAAAELAARQQMASEAMQRAQLSASLRGPSNAFAQLATNQMMNQAGLSPLAAILTGQQRVPAYGATGTPEAATLGTLSRDMGETGYTAPGGYGSGVTSGYGIAGLYGQANQYTADPYSEAGRMAMSQAVTNREVSQNYNSKLGGPDIGPGSSPGARATKAFTDLIASRNGVVPNADDPDMIGIYKAAWGIGEAQARIASRFAHDYYASYGVAMDEGKLNDMVGGQVAMGAAPDPKGWRTSPPALLPGHQAPIAWNPQTDPYQPPVTITPPAGSQPPPAGPGQIAPAPSPQAPPGPSYVPPVVPFTPSTPPAPTAPGGAVPANQPGQPAVGQAPGQPLPAPGTVPASPAPTPVPAPTAPAAQQWVTLPDGRGAYKSADGSLYDGAGTFLGKDPATAAWTSYYGAKPVAQATSAMVAPAPAPVAPTPAAPEPAPAPTPAPAPAPAAPPPPPAETFTFGLIGPNSQYGYTGTSGSRFDVSWNRL